MLYELAKMFSGKGERRGAERKATAFPVRWMKDENTPVDGAGQEISPTGALFILKEKPPTPEFTINIKLDERVIHVRVMTTRHDQVTQGGTTWHRFATKFAGIAADDWDAIVRYVGGKPLEAGSKVAEELAAAPKQDDAFRLLPLAVQKQIVDILVAANHLAQPGEGQAPLLRMTYSGATKRVWQEIHRCHVHSRLDIDGELRQYDTTFLIDNQGRVQVQGSR